VRLPLNLLFTPKWMSENIMTGVCRSLDGYLQELALILDAYWHEKIVGWCLASTVAQYTLRLVNAEHVQKVLNVKYGGGFGRSGFKANEERLRKLYGDELELQQTFAPFLGPENLTLILQPLKSAREMLQSEESILPDILELALRAHPVVSVEVFLMFERALGLREDLSKSEKKRHLEEAKKLCFTYGQPLDEAEELLAMSEWGLCVAAGGIGGTGVQSGLLWLLAMMFSHVPLLYLLPVFCS